MIVVLCSGLLFCVSAVWIFLPLACELSAGSVSGASASSGELDREIKDGNSRDPATGILGAAGEPGGMTTDKQGLIERERKKNRNDVKLVKSNDKDQDVCDVF